MRWKGEISEQLSISLALQQWQVCVLLICPSSNGNKHEHIRMLPWHPKCTILQTAAQFSSGDAVGLMFAEIGSAACRLAARMKWRLWQRARQRKKTLRWWTPSPWACPASRMASGTSVRGVIIRLQSLSQRVICIYKGEGWRPGRTALNNLQVDDVHRYSDVDSMKRIRSRSFSSSSASCAECSVLLYVVLEEVDQKRNGKVNLKEFLYSIIRMRPLISLSTCNRQFLACFVFRSSVSSLFCF